VVQEMTEAQAYHVERLVNLSFAATPQRHLYCKKQMEHEHVILDDASS
jgi:hypothetical protein